MAHLVRVEGVLRRSWRRSDDVARGGIFEVGEFLVTSEENFLMKGVGCDTVGGGSGPYKSVKCFESLEIGKESTVKSYKDYVLFSCLLGIFASDLPNLFLRTVLT